MDDPAGPSIPRPVCREIGCAKTAERRGLCKMHYQRIIRGSRVFSDGSPVDTKRSWTKEQRVQWELDRAIRSGSCLLTQAPISSGYGAVRFNGKQVGLHRLSLEVKIGRELRPGEQANHTCHRKACINPDHLYAGSQWQNMLDSAAIGALPGNRKGRGEKNGRAKLSVGAVRDIRRRATGETQKQLALEYGVSQSLISKIIRGAIWLDT